MKEEAITMERSGHRKGVARQLMGVALLSLGLLNMMLTLKTGGEPEMFNFALLIGGAILLGSGLWRYNRS